MIQAGLDDRSVVVAKFYRSGRWTDAQILEEHAFAAELVHDEVPVVAPLPLNPRPGSSVSTRGAPPTLGVCGDIRFSVTPRCGGRAPELDAPGTLKRLGLFLGRLHRTGEKTRFAHRVDWHDASPARRAVASLESSHALPPGARDTWLRAAQDVIAAATDVFRTLPDLQVLRIHGDCHPGNVLWTDDGPHFVDLDDAVNGPAIQDLWMLVSGNRESRRAELGELLDGYETYREFDWRELRLVEALRGIRMLHHSAWLAQRWDDPAFPVAFPWFGDEAYWLQQVSQLRDQTALIREDLDAIP